MDIENSEIIEREEEKSTLTSGLSAGKEILYNVLVYSVLYVISFFAVVLLIRLPLFKGINVLMYRGIIMIIIAGALASCLLVLFRKWKKISWLKTKDAVMVFIITCCINMVFFTLIPVTVERSVSVFMLSYMDTYNEKSFTREDIEEVFEKKYVDEYGAFEKRFEEQISTGTIKRNEDESYSITSKGSFIVGLFRLISNMYDTDKRLVYP